MVAGHDLPKQQLLTPLICTCGYSKRRKVARWFEYWGDVRWQNTYRKHIEHVQNSHNILYFMESRTSIKKNRRNRTYKKKNHYYRSQTNLYFVYKKMTQIKKNAQRLVIESTHGEVLNWPKPGNSCPALKKVQVSSLKTVDNKIIIF